MADESSSSNPVQEKNGRLIFISASFLVHNYRNYSASQLETALFFFGSKRSWLFPTTIEEREESRRQPTNYLAFPKDFLQLILEKEKQGFVHFLKPHMDYQIVSSWLESIVDLTTGVNYKPLILDPEWWHKTWKKESGRFTKSPLRVVLNFQTGEHDYTSTMELLYQSNPSLIPILGR